MTETKENVRETVHDEIKKYMPSTIEVLKAMDRGLTAKEATLIVKGKTSLTPAAEHRIKEKYRKYSLSSPQMVKMAHNAVKDALQMKPITYTAEKVCAGIGVVDYTETIMPSITNRLAAAAMVADRVEPIIRRNENVNVNVDLDPVDMGKYLNRGKDE